jgi:hypothetical protein
MSPHREVRRFLEFCSRYTLWLSRLETGKYDGFENTTKCEKRRYIHVALLPELPQQSLNGRRAYEHLARAGVEVFQSGDASSPLFTLAMPPAALLW